MSVMRGSRVGEFSGRRGLAVRAAMVVGLVDALLVGCWFALVAFEPRRPYTVLAGLTVLVFGAVIRTGLIGETAGPTWTIDRPSPHRLVVATCYAIVWLGWLVAVETFAFAPGLAVSTILLGGGLLACHLLHWSVLTRLRTTDRSIRRHSQRLRAATIPALLYSLAGLFLGLLAWYDGPAFVATSIPFGELIVRLEVPIVLFGLFGLWCCSVLGTHRFLRAVPTS
ncbi:hypothetical protein [Halovivax limisalsi]|uniref:hypothetical protein n=1 Tax=Halovivax limisalsi TaxID=1453760 RepID=UPI001FFDC6A0|nr:hypothetical protein [Halovivax limisalsi]